METEPYLLAYTLKSGGQTLLVAVNADGADHILTLPEAGWDILADGQRAGTGVIGRVEDSSLILPPRTGVVLARRGVPS